MLCFCEFQVSDWDRGTNWALQANRVLWGISGEQKGCCVLLLPIDGKMQHLTQVIIHFYRKISQFRADGVLCGCPIPKIQESYTQNVFSRY